MDTKPTSFDVPSKEEIESWVAEHATQWPNAPQWLQSAWSSSLEEIKHRLRVNADVKHGQAQQLQRREERKRQFEPLLACLTAELQAAGEPSFNLAHHVALAHENRYRDIGGDTPLERVQDLLVTDAATAQLVLATLDKVLHHMTKTSAVTCC
jgi:hypothetical protein